MLLQRDAGVLERGLELLEGQPRLRAPDAQLVCARLGLERDIEVREQAGSVELAASACHQRARRDCVGGLGSALHQGLADSPHVALQVHHGEFSDEFGV